MTVLLEPVYLADVLLFIEGVRTAKAFPLISTHCREAALALKTNPVVFAHSPLSDSSPTST